MKIKIALITYYSVLFVSCSRHLTISSNDTTSALKLITNLHEFKKADRRVDSLKKTVRYPMQLTVSVLKTPFNREDSIKHIITGFINLDRGMDQLILYTVKIDSSKNKVLSVTKNTGSEIQNIVN